MAKKKKKKKAVPKKVAPKRKLVHEDMVTIAVRDEFTPILRGLAEETGLSLAKVLRDAVLVYRVALRKGHVAGSLLADHKAKLAGKATGKKKKKKKKK